MFTTTPPTSHRAGARPAPCAAALPAMGRRWAAVAAAMAVAASMLLLLSAPGCARLDPLGHVSDVFQPTTPQEAVEMATDRYDPDNRRRGLALLARAPWGGEPPYLALYRAAATDEDATVRAVALMALGMHGGPQDGPVLVRHLGHENKLLRWEAARALGRIHYPDAALPLIRVLREDDDPDIRQAAATALGQYRRVIVFDALVSALDDPSFAVALAARRSLELLTGHDLGEDRRDWVAWKDEVGVNRMFEEAGPHQWRPYTRPGVWWDRIIPPFSAPRRAAPRLPAGWPQEQENAG